MNPFFLADFYKIGHIDQYAPGVTRVWSNWTPRGSRIPGVNRVIHFGLQPFLLKMENAFRDEFFDIPKNVVIAQYKTMMDATIGGGRTDHSEIVG